MLVGPNDATQIGHNEKPETSTGTVYAAGPEGIWNLSPESKHLGTIKAAEVPANFARGDDDGRTMYITARTGLNRVRLNIPGVRPGATTRTARVEP